ncbi:diacylglycerol kinase family lipid kinase [Parabacteroides sp. 52]|uniref:diacylglycerol/lipid kinase family protein n=1 Tax=unclassified Parabacteroides TaxID=2649774 RepID=UPI0013D1C59E|nr:MULTISPECIES: diacylglycerol kinase family protein [unclassified Parabacteroides]NDV55044.1 diacylglycerol kinase family lipid kinase [Parabacteroides sp. 52]
MEEQQIKVHAIINPISGVGSKRKIPKMIEEVFSKDKADLTISFTEYAGHASELTCRAIDAGANTILAVGGDGTVNEVAKSMLFSEAVLGIIPKGSGNGLARELHIPMDVKRALEVIVKGRVSAIDSCKADDRVFFCTCGVGFDAAVSQKFANEKHRGSLTYIKNTVEEYLSYKPEVYELMIDNRTIQEKAFLVACANASQYGNNAFIAPHANIQDGQMNITILSPFTPLDIAPLAIQLFTRQIDRNSKIKSFKGQDITIVRQKPGVMHLDGEPVKAGREIHLSVMPQSLKVYIPDTVSFTEEVYHLFGEVTRFFDKRLPYIFR